MVAPLPKNSKPRARVIAFYLPQFHPIPENDAWWGTGFTEWTPVVKAKPLFRGHRQPRIPTELGFYDLRVPEVREQQAALARDHGIEGFCYWHYWLGDGRRLLERPFDEVLVSGKPDFPFCLGWANHDWKGTIFGAGKRCLIEQRYPGRHDHEEHFRYLLRAFQDSRYIRVDDKPLLYIYRPQEIPNAEAVFDLWRDMALQAGLTGLHIVGAQYGKTNPRTYGLDSAHCVRHRKIAALRVRVEGLIDKLFSSAPRLRDLILAIMNSRLKKYPYRRAIRHMLQPSYAAHEIPEISPNWDTTPRYGRDAVIFTGATPELFRELVSAAITKIEDRDPEHRLIFLKSWNEWAEGNYIEPDEEYGRARLEVLREELLASTKPTLAN
jgi:hypothetical protein